MSTSTSAKPVNVNCPACQTVNPAAEVNSKCSACSEPLAAAVLQQSIDDLRRLTESMSEHNTPSFKSFNGFGTTLLDYHEREGGGWEATRWVIAMGLPLVPLASYVIHPKRQEGGYGRVESYFEILGRVPLSPARILRVYGLVVVGVAPILLGSLYSGWVNHTLGGTRAFFAMLAAIVWGVYIIFFRIKNDTKAYKRAATS